MSTGWSQTKGLVFASLCGAMSAILQSAGGFFPGIGYFISPFATAPIILACLVVSLQKGILSYGVATVILLIIQPSELFVFPFTTGLLGLGLGIAFHFFARRIPIVLTGGTFLWFGILFVLYVIKFPLLGPEVSATFSLWFILSIFLLVLLIVGHGQKA